MTEQTQEELSNEVGKLAGETRGPDRYVVSSVALLIKSNARLEQSIDEFSQSTAKTERTMKNLAVAQVMLAVGAIIAAIIWH